MHKLLELATRIWENAQSIDADITRLENLAGPISESASETEDLFRKIFKRLESEIRLGKTIAQEAEKTYRQLLNEKRRRQCVISKEEAFVLEVFSNLAAEYWSSDHLSGNVMSPSQLVGTSDFTHQSAYDFLYSLDFCKCIRPGDYPLFEINLRKMLPEGLMEYKYWFKDSTELAATVAFLLMQKLGVYPDESKGYFEDEKLQMIYEKGSESAESLEIYIKRRS